MRHTKTCKTNDYVRVIDFAFPGTDRWLLAKKRGSCGNPIVTTRRSAAFRFLSIRQPTSGCREPLHATCRNGNRLKSEAQRRFICFAFRSRFQTITSSWRKFRWITLALPNWLGARRAHGGQVDRGNSFIIELIRSGEIRPCH